RLERALECFPEGDAVEVAFRAFELDPAAPREVDLSVSYVERLARKYGASRQQAEGMIRAMTETAAGDGIVMRFDIIRPGNTFDAHRLLHHARGRGLGLQLKERLLRAYLCEGAPIGDHATLARLAGETGLAEEEAVEVLASDTHAHQVRSEEAQARSLGITGVPFFVIDGRFALAGAQPSDTILHALHEARATRPEPPAATAEGAPLCGPDGC
ncbi:MAG: DsbA family oxidoreductase, partial [Myxococcota bacterium]